MNDGDNRSFSSHFQMFRFSMSSPSNLTTAWKTAEGYFFWMAGPVMMLIDLIGWIINLLVFTKKNLRKNPCAIYFICSPLLQLTMDLGFYINPRLRLYSAVLFNTLSLFYLVLASIDQSSVTSPNALTRRRSIRSLAVLCLIVGTIVWSLFYSHVLIFSTILQWTPTVSVRYFQRGIYRAFI